MVYGHILVHHHITVIHIITVALMRTMIMKKMSATAVQNVWIANFLINAAKTSITAVN
jgi:hypothetical protein